MQLKMAGELWAGYLHRMDYLQKEQQHLTWRLGEIQARQEHSEGSVLASNALMLETEALLQNLCLQREHIIHLIRRFLLEVLTPFQVGCVAAPCHMTGVLLFFGKTQRCPSSCQLVKINLQLKPGTFGKNGCASNASTPYTSSGSSFWRSSPLLSRWAAAWLPSQLAYVLAFLGKR